MKLGSVLEQYDPREKVSSSQQGALVSGIAVHLGHLPLLGQIGLEWGSIHLVVVRRSVQNKVSIIPNIGTDKLHQDGSKQFKMVKKLTG